MKNIILAALTALPFSSHAQQAADFRPFPDNGIYESASDFTNHVLTDGFNTGQPGYRLHDESFKHAVKIDQPGAGEVEMPTDKLWGERVKDVDYRRFKGDLYRVEHTDRIFVYSKSDSAPLIASSLVAYYFSRTADSPVYLITSENLANVYYDQPDKKALFENVDALNTNPAQQAAKLTQLFYTTDTTGKATSSAE